MDRYRNWCFTSFNEPKVTIEPKYMIYQKELCPTTKREHYQGYIEFKDKYSMKKIKEIFNDNTIHLEVRKGSQKQAVEYCCKEESRAPNALPVVYGKLTGQGHRTDLDEMMDDIEEGHTAREILLRHRGNALRHINHIRKGLQVFHNLDMIDMYILNRREAPLEDDDRDPIAIIQEANNNDAKLDAEAWDGH